MNDLDLSLKERIARLEGAVGWERTPVPLRKEYAIPVVGFLVLSIVLTVWAVGFPNHHYQLVLALLVVLLCYQREAFARTTRILTWAYAVLNTAILTLVCKLLIGLGEKYPLAWMKLPSVTLRDDPESTLGKIVPNLNIAWGETPLAQWAIDFTILQTFLLLLTIVAALFEFQPFASLTALLLLILSLPALMGFNWDYLFWGIICAAVGLYLQTRDANAQ